MCERSGSRRQTAEEIRQDLLDIVRVPEEHTDGYPFYSPPPHARAIGQLVDFGDHRVVEALEDLVQRDEVNEARPDHPRADQDRASKDWPRNGSAVEIAGDG